MVNPPEFPDLSTMESSQWLGEIKEKFKHEIWPSECQRCEQTEVQHNTSIRLNSIALDQVESQRDYLQIGGVLDNLCNAACQTCNADHSTRIGSLSGRVFPIVDNSGNFWQLPQERILHLDINGGEPCYSKNYKKLLQNLPPNLKTLRVNTNCSAVITELEEISKKGIEVTVTVSFDGVGQVHEFVRWPLVWEDFYKNLMVYKSMPVKLNLWTTVSVLNVDDLPNIIKFAKDHEIDHSYAYLKYPNELSIDNKNHQQIQDYIQLQKELRKIV